MAIDDSDDILILIKTTLDDVGMRADVFKDAKLALENLDMSYDLILLDLMMPDMSGRDFIEGFKKSDFYKNIPIIILTAESNSDSEISELFELGISDYIQKPFHHEEFIARVKNQAHLKRLTCRIKYINKKLKIRNHRLNNSIAREEKLSQKILDKTMKLKNAINKIGKLNDKLRFASTHDRLTGIYNRGAILDFLENDMLRAKRMRTKLSIAMIDIDHFKEVNDTYGHQLGDAILKMITGEIKKSTREIDLFGRYGGEEFLLILPDTALCEAVNLTERIMSKIRLLEYKDANLTLKKTVSMGVTEFRIDESENSLIERADKALYSAKTSGRDKIITI